MSSFEDLLGQYESPSEVDIVVPGKVGAAGSKGGNAPAATAPAPAGTPTDSHPASTAPEPEPQLPEGSDPDEKESAPEDEGPDPVQDSSPVETVEVNASDDETLDPDGSDDEPVLPESVPAATVSSHPVIPRKGGGLSFEGESAYLKQFPRVMIDQMREILRPQLGEAFARDISQVSIVTAFAMATMGTEITTDEITDHAVQAFRANDPKTDAIEKRTAVLLEQQTKVEGVLKKVFEKLNEVADTSAVLEMGQAYALAERTAHLDTDGALPETIDVTQKRAVASRDNIRKRVKAQQRDEKIRAGRPIR